jgi:hypothetical protein
MHKVLLLGLVLAVAAGCKRDKNDPTKKDSPPPTPPPAGGGGAGGGGGVGGGSGGAPQAVRGAVQRTVNLNELKNVQLFIETASAASGRMPSPQEVAAALQKEAPKTFALLQDGSIVLTGTRSREAIWAYTRDPQSGAGEHLVITSSDIGRMPAAELGARLQQQGQ